MRRWFVLLSLAAGLAVSAGYLIIDHKVTARLRSHESASVSALYSDILAVPQGSEVDLPRLRGQLINRRYQEIVPGPVNPGEFSYSPSLIHVHLREFVGPDGYKRTSRIVRVRPVAEESFEVEPQVVTVLGGGDVRASEYKSLKQLPPGLKRAVIAIEDERFFSHMGMDVQGIFRALIENIRAGQIVQGGSTITQQLAKNLFFSPKRSISRKLLEVLAALSLERHLSKDQILEMYLNEVYLGQEGAVAIHGFAKASEIFFGKQVADLTLAEAAALAGIIKAPSFYSPRNHPQRAVHRRDTVLKKMQELSLIDEEAYKSAARARLMVVKERQYQRRAPHLTASLQTSLGRSIDVQAAVSQGVSLFTGLDIDMQECGERAVMNGLSALEKRHPNLRRKGKPLEAALVSIEPYSGKVRAWVGGRDYSENQFDHVSQAKRQIGSTIKPFLYLTALDRHLNDYKQANALTVLPDRPIEIDLITRQHWVPENYDHEFRGDVTLRYALENSLNIPAVYTVTRFGVPALVKTARRFRIAGRVDAVPALALGAADTTLLDLTTAYAALANGGVYISPRPFISAVDSKGRILASSEITEERVADENAVYVLTNILFGVVERGTARGIRQLGYALPVAGKTGTSNETRDAWFVGFTPDLATGVWVGYDDNKRIGLTGGAAAVPIWTEYMKCISPLRRPADFVVPRGVVFVEVDPVTGRRVSKACPSVNAVREVFIRGTEPVIDCNTYRGVPREEVPDHDILAEPPRRKRSFWDRWFGG